MLSQSYKLYEKLCQLNVKKDYFFHSLTHLYQPKLFSHTHFLFQHSYQLDFLCYKQLIWFQYFLRQILHNYSNTLLYLLKEDYLYNQNRQRHHKQNLMLHLHKSHCRLDHHHHHQLSNHLDQMNHQKYLLFHYHFRYSLIFHQTFGFHQSCLCLNP